MEYLSDGAAGACAQDERLLKRPRSSQEAEICDERCSPALEGVHLINDHDV